MLPLGLRHSLTLTAPPPFDVGDPAACVLSLDEAKKHCRVDFPDDDGEIEAFIATATAELDGAEGSLGRALLTQGWTLKASGFGHLVSPFYFVPGNTLATGLVGATSGRIKIPLPPLQTIDRIQYVDINGTLQTLDPSIYQIVAGGVGHSWIAPAYGQSWPAHRLTPDSVRIDFTAGYGAGTDVPAPIKHAVKLRVNDLYQNRANVVISETRAVVLQPGTIESLLSRYQASWF